MFIFRDGQREQGFTLVEMLIVIVIIGILGGIAVTTWQGFLARQRLVQSSDRLFRTLKSTRETAKHRHVAWQVSIRQGASRVEFATHPADPHYFIPMTVWEDPRQWETLAPGVRIDLENDRGGKETNLDATTIADQSAWSFLFNHQGCPVKTIHNSCTDVVELGRLGLRIEGGSDGPYVLRRCIIFSTVLGIMRQGRGHSTQDRNQRYCY